MIKITETETGYKAEVRRNPTLSQLRMAAPAMYEALKAICETGSLLRDDCLPEGLAEQIDKALAKAEGREE